LKALSVPATVRVLQSLRLVQCEIPRSNRPEERPCQEPLGRISRPVPEPLLPLDRYPDRGRPCVLLRTTAPDMRDTRYWDRVVADTADAKPISPDRKPSSP